MEGIGGEKVREGCEKRMKRMSERERVVEDVRGGWRVKDREEV